MFLKLIIQSNLLVEMKQCIKRPQHPIIFCAWSLQRRQQLWGLSGIIKYLCVPHTTIDLYNGCHALRVVKSIKIFFHCLRSQGPFQKNRRQGLSVVTTNYPSLFSLDTIFQSCTYESSGVKSLGPLKYPPKCPVTYLPRGFQLSCSVQCTLYINSYLRLFLFILAILWVKML